MCSYLVKVKKEERSEDSKIDIKVEHNSSCHRYSSSSSCRANDIKPVIIKHEIKKEEYDPDCDCNDCRVAQGKVIRVTIDDVVLSTTQNQTDQHEADCGCSVCVQNVQVTEHDPANQGANDLSVDLPDQPTCDDSSRSSTPDWMPSIFSSDDDETEDDDETTQDERDDDDDHDFSLNDEEEIQNDEDADDTQVESEEASVDNKTRVPVKKISISIEAKYKCPVEDCPKAFKRRDYLKQHMPVHTGVRPFPCKQCIRKFARKLELTRHVQDVHQKTKKWRCIWSTCKYRSFYCASVVSHVKAVHFKNSDNEKRDPKGYIKKCKKVTSDEEEESRNVDKSKPKSNFITVHLNCLDCNKTFKTRDELKGHQLKAHQIQQFRCLVKDCSVSFEEKKKFFQHRSVKHRSCRTWPCQECGSQMKTYHILVNHFRLQHQKGRFVCAQTGCHVETDTIRDMVTHTLVHKSPIHRCLACGCNKLFKIRHVLLEHERTHTGERPFLCEQCNKRYNTNKQLKNHILAKHQNQKPFSCKWNNCNFVDGYLSSVYRHVRAHFKKAGDDVKRKINDFIERHYDPVTTAAGTSKETNVNSS